MFGEGFLFSQTSLQDFVECPRRFQLRYVDVQSWPAVQSQPVVQREHHVELGKRFHRLVERHQLGLSPGLLGGAIDDPQLRKWWQAYLGFDYLHSMEGVRYPEFLVSVDLEGYRVVAAYDLLVVQPDGMVVIFDWKTYGRRPGDKWFSSRMQSRLYPLVLVTAGSHGGLDFPVDPERVLLVYWLAELPEVVVKFPYSSAQFDRDKEYVLSVLQSVSGAFRRADWVRTSDEAVCRFCEYRSLCGRNVPVDDFRDSGNEDDNISREGLFLWEDVFEVGF